MHDLVTGFFPACYCHTCLPVSSDRRIAGGRVPGIVWQKLLAVDLRACVPLLSAEINVRCAQECGWVGRCDLALPGCLVKECTNTANGVPRAPEEKGIQLTATIQTVTKDSFIRQWRLFGLKRNFFKGKE